MVRNFKYPKAFRSEKYQDYHGIKVIIPYRWMEDEHSPEVKKWIEEQDQLTREYFSKLTRRKSIHQRLKQLYSGIDVISTPTKIENKYYYFKYPGSLNQPLYCVKEKEQERIILDVNKLSEDQTVSVGSISLSEDGKFLAYTTCESGSDWQILKILNTETGENLADEIPWVRHTHVAWMKDNSGFYYSRYPDPKSVPSGKESYHNKLYYHQLNTNYQQDKLIYYRPQNPEWAYIPTISEDEQYLIVNIWEGTERKNRIFYSNLNENTELIPLIFQPDAEYSFLGNDHKKFYFLTNNQAPRYRIISIDIDLPQVKQWKEVIPEKEHLLELAVWVRGKFYTSYLENVVSKIKIYDQNGSPDGEISLPEMGTVYFFRAKSASSEILFSFSSFFIPMTIYEYDVLSDNLNVYYKPEVNFNPSQFTARQIFYTSKDKTKIPMFLLHRKDLIIDGNCPVILYGYGGFSISLTPGFSEEKIFWLENGGIFAIANLRGGGEFGEEWHQQGMLANKQNVFDDFIQAGKWLIDNNYTSSEKLAIMGGSNGGLLVSAVMVQQPELWGAVICRVPVIDMLRYNKFTVGRYWVSEYGKADNPEHFHFLYRYSPVHNVEDGQEYPPTFILTADHDDRVAPCHAWKFAAQLQHSDSGKNPILLRFERKAGHGHGKPMWKIIDQFTDIFSFLFNEMNIQPGGKDA
ncbi:MAG: prolyl oligopeptidase family serine peptidase [bacterium]